MALESSDMNSHAPGRGAASRRARRRSGVLPAPRRAARRASSPRNAAVASRSSTPNDRPHRRIGPSGSAAMRVPSGAWTTSRMTSPRRKNACRGAPPGVGSSRRRRKSRPASRSAAVVRSRSGVKATTWSTETTPFGCGAPADRAVARKPLPADRPARLLPGRAVTTPTIPRPLPDRHHPQAHASTSSRSPSGSNPAARHAPGGSAIVSSSSEGAAIELFRLEAAARPPCAPGFGSSPWGPRRRRSWRPGVTAIRPSRQPFRPGGSSRAAAAPYRSMPVRASSASLRPAGDGAAGLPPDRRPPRASAGPRPGRSAFAPCRLASTRRRWPRGALRRVVPRLPAHSTAGSRPRRARQPRSSRRRRSPASPRA